MTSLSLSLRRPSLRTTAGLALGLALGGLAIVLPAVGLDSPPVSPPIVAATQVADFDGDGTTDIAVFRASEGVWLKPGQPNVYLGAAGDVPAPCDYDGDGTSDEAVFRPTVGGWYGTAPDPVFYGNPGDVPVPGDYNGDGRCEIAVFRPSVGGWYVNGASPVFFGLAGDIPVPGDYNADHIRNIGVFCHFNFSAGFGDDKRFAVSAVKRSPFGMQRTDFV